MINPAEEFLSPRLKAVHDMAVAGAEDLKTRRIIDVGSDHGHLSLYSLINDNFASAVLTDIHKAPAQRSEDTLRVYGYADRTEVYCTDGLDGVELKKGDIVVMAGLGGNNMIDIMTRVLERGDTELLKTITWVLQPQKSSDRLRVFLFENGFNIEDENASEDRGLYYLIIKAVYTGAPSDYTLKQKYYGPVILKRIADKEPVVMGYKDRLDRRFELSKRGDEEIKRMLEENQDEQD